jgi:filamentous hemagglutinin family protein
MKTIFSRRLFWNWFQRDSRYRRALAAVVAFSFTRNVVANPTGMTVQRGAASQQANGSSLTVNAGNNAVLNWQSFNIGNGEATIFNQPSASSVVWNRINGQSPSQIYGSLQANGVVVLLNSSGFYFGPNSQVSAAGLVVSTADCLPPQNSGGSWTFNGPPPLISIVNYGQIQIGNGGNCFFIADQVENHGRIEAPGGNVGFAAGQTVTLCERPDGRGMSMQVTLPQGSVDNHGNVIADGGTIALNARVVNQNGLLQANSVREQNGVIELTASDTLNLGADSKILAQGDDSAAGSAGGIVTLKSENAFSDAAGSSIVTAGGANGGNGGNIEVSAPSIQSLNSAMDARAQAGFSGGEFLLDPVNILLGTSGSGVPDNSGGVAYNSGTGTVNINVNTAFANKNFSNIKLQATGNITLGANTAWDLSGSTGQAAGQLALQAGGDIIFNSGSKITDANYWSVSLQAGYNFVNNVVSYGLGNIYLNGGNNLTLNGAIQLAQGNVKLLAGNSIQVGSGYVITTGGGSIDAQALKGNINTGSDAQGYHFNTHVGSLGQAYDLSDGLGGISTAAGGDVTLIAGGNVSSVLPTLNGYYYNGTFTAPNNGNEYATAGSGAYGTQAGNVTVVAGGNVTGSYLVANGTGNIHAGVKMDANGNTLTDAAGNYVLGAIGSAGTDALNPNLALNLIKGGWNVSAAQNILLQEVRNPNGLFDTTAGSAFNHYFNYAPDAYVNLTAGNMVQLGANYNSLPRVDQLVIPFLYAPILNVSAGAGGVVLHGDSKVRQLILFPSPEGGLTINTADGGGLTGQIKPINGTPQIFNLIVSDSGLSQYTSSSADNFGLNDHAPTPVHLNSPTSIALNIDGDMNSVYLGAPEAAQITVGGNMNNCRFQGMNLHPTDATRITVQGDINNRSAFTSVNLTALSQQAGWQAPELSYLAQALSSDPTALTLSTSFYYDPATKVLTYQNIPGKSLANVLQLLQNLPVQVYQNGVPQWTDALQTVPLTTTVSVIDSATAQALLNQYNALGGPLPSVSFGYFNGYRIGGGGQFDITARNMDLGSTVGIQSAGVALYKIRGNYPLANYFNTGADINVSLTGDLDMLSASIASLNGGNISINAGGTVNAGSSQFTVNSAFARGIYSTSLGDVSVIAGGDVNVNGSRIAGYDGGNVTVDSLNGDVNAGTGGSGFVVLSAYYVDPVTHQVYYNAPTIPGSGILATTFPARNSTYPAPAYSVGNILVEAPNGNVNASAGGIVQLPLNGLKNPNALVDVLAGYELRDSQGNPVSASDMASGTATSVSAGQNIDASGSGVIGNNVNLEASGSITGVIFSRGNINLSAQQNANVTALAQGTVAANAGGTLSGTIIGVGGVSASGGAVDATVLSQNASVNGGSTGDTFAQGTAANATSSAMSADSSGNKPVQTTATEEEDLLKKKKGISLAQKVSRVTVILPPKNLSEVTDKQPKI